MSYQTLTIQNTVNDFVKKDSKHAMEVFHTLGIDFCCGGMKSLEIACVEKGLDPEEVFKQLSLGHGFTAEDWNALSASELVDHILSRHHVYLKKAFPEIFGLMEKVLEAHGRKYPHLQTLKETLEKLRADLEPHMLKEERVLFPMIIKLEETNFLDPGKRASLQNPIRVMQSEHEAVGILLKKIRQLTNDFSVPEDACNTYRFLFQKLEELEWDTFSHIHKKNNVLFPRVMNEINQDVLPSK